MLITHTEEFDIAYRFVTETNQNIFLTGKAGTGKTTFLKYLQNNSPKNILVAAPTGVAAINARGITLHSLFQLPFGIILPDINGAGRNHPLLSQLHYSSEKLRLLRGMELLVIDEASMVASYTLDAIDMILRHTRRKPHQPFGGVQLLLIGDLYQLPPVIKNEEWEILQNFYSSVFFFDSYVLRNNLPVIIELREIFRQKDDKFIEILNGIRNNNISEENFNLLNSRLNRYFTQQDNDGYITLTTHNYLADETNTRKLSNLASKTFKFHAEIAGEFPENIFPGEKELILKCGAQVMFLKNDLEGKQYFNGKIGVITKLDENSIKVKCTGDSTEIEVNQCKWENINYKFNQETSELTEELLGAFIQYPLRLAWAITIHKSQGLTFNKVVIDAEKAFAIGQVYVALSRCTSLEGLVLKTPVNKNYLGAHKDLREWQNQRSETNLSESFTESRQRYAADELYNIFTWRNWYFGLKALNEFIMSNQGSPGAEGKISSESIPWIQDLLKEQAELYEVSEKFKQLISRLRKENNIIEKNELLQKRIKDGANYFYNEIKKWEQQFLNHPISADTKKAARKIDKLLQELSNDLQDILQKINYCKNGFFLDDYLKKRKSLTGNVKYIRSSYTKFKSIDNTIKDIPHPELYRKLSGYRSRTATELGMPAEKILSDKGMRNICTYLPFNKNDLRKIRGVGYSVVEIRGNEIMSLIKEYYKENSITQEMSINPDAILTKPDTVQATLKYFREGKTITEIAKERNLVTGTIEGHLAKAIRQSLIQIQEIMPIEEVEKIRKYFPEDLNDIRLTQIKESMPPEVTFGQLRIVLAWIEKEKS